MMFTLSKPQHTLTHPIGSPLVVALNQVFPNGEIDGRPVQEFAMFETRTFQPVWNVLDRHAVRNNVPAIAYGLLL